MPDSCSNARRFARAAHPNLEPRIVYSYVPYRNQDGLPIFGSGLPDLNLTELFRTNRYVGEDRMAMRIRWRSP